MGVCFLKIRAVPHLRLRKEFAMTFNDIFKSSFLENMTSISLLDMTITLGRLLSLVAVYGVRGLKEFIGFRKIRKGGAVK